MAFNAKKQRNFVQSGEEPTLPNDFREIKAMEGYVSRILTKKDGDWCIIELEQKNPDGGVTVRKCMGVIQGVTEGAYFRLTGSYKQDKYTVGKFVFNVTKSDLAFDNSKKGIVDFLSTEFNGIGPVMADRLYEKFGNNTLLLLQDSHETADCVKGYTAQIAVATSAQLRKNTKYNEIRRRLYGIGLKKGLIDKILNHYANAAYNVEEVIRKDCFSLTEINGVGFVTVSNIANMLGIERSDPGRISAAIVYAMMELEDNDGHSCVERKDLIERVTKLLGFYHDNIEAQIDFASQNGNLMQAGGKYNICYLLKQELDGEEDERNTEAPDLGQPSDEFYSSISNDGRNRENNGGTNRVSGESGSGGTTDSGRADATVRGEGSSSVNERIIRHLAKRATGVREGDVGTGSVPVSALNQRILAKTKRSGSASTSRTIQGGHDSDSDPRGKEWDMPF